MKAEKLCQYSGGFSSTGSLRWKSFVKDTCCESLDV